MTVDQCGPVAGSYELHDPSQRLGPDGQLSQVPVGDRFVGVGGIEYRLRPEGHQRKRVPGDGYAVVTAGSVPEVDDVGDTELFEQCLAGGQVEMVEVRSEEHTSELQSRPHLVCRLL